MKKIIVCEGQNILDICIQEYGSVEALVQLAIDNDLRIDADLTAGQELVINSDHILNTRLVDFFIKEGEKINTGSYEDVTDDEGGIFDNTFDNTFN